MIRMFNGELSKLNKYEMEEMIKELPEEKQLFLFRYIKNLMGDNESFWNAVRNWFTEGYDKRED